VKTGHVIKEYAAGLIDFLSFKTCIFKVIIAYSGPAVT